MRIKQYITYEDPFTGHVFDEKQMHEVYRDLADKKEYPDFQTWLLDMIHSGVFEKLDEEESFDDWDDDLKDFFSDILQED